LNLSEILIIIAPVTRQDSGAPRVIMLSKTAAIMMCLVLFNIGTISAKQVESNIVFSSYGIKGHKLSGILNYDNAEVTRPVVIVCHPHPSYGGSMKIAAIESLTNFLLNKRFSVFRFNFRGVGSSEGEFDQGQHGQKDLRGALAYILSNSEVKPSRVFVFGYSYGAAVSFATSFIDRRIDGAVLVGLPSYTVNIFKDNREINNRAVPVLVITGSEDFYSSGMKGALSKFSKIARHKVNLTVIPNADHSFTDRWEDIFRVAAAYFGKISGVK